MKNDVLTGLVACLVFWVVFFSMLRNAFAPLISGIVALGIAVCAGIICRALSRWQNFPSRTVLPFSTEAPGETVTVHPRELFLEIIAICLFLVLLSLLDINISGLTSAIFGLAVFVLICTWIFVGIRAARYLGILLKKEI
jgi:hypothetical protein